MTICKTLRVGRTPTTGFSLTADKYSNPDGTPFTTTLHVSYPTKPAGTTVSIVLVSETTDSCTTDTTLGTGGLVDIPSYAVNSTKEIYAMVKEGDCCTSFSFPLCLVSNYVSFTVADAGNIQFLSNPSGAHIWSAPTGQTPTDSTKATPDIISGLPIGNYDYILKLAHFNDYIGPVPITVIKDATAIVGPIDLILLEGCISFKSTPSNARIYLAPAGQPPIDTGLNTPNIICDNPLGGYTYKLTLLGHEDAIGSVTLVSGHGETVDVTMVEVPVLVSIAISPTNPSVTVGTNQQFSANKIDQYGHPIDIAITWSSSNTYVGTIDQNSGLLSALHEGTTIITGLNGAVHDTTTATVTPLIPVLTSIFPSSVSLLTGETQQFTAKDQNNNTISTGITWLVQSGVGSIDTTGLYSAGSTIGSATISATYFSITKTALITVQETCVPNWQCEEGLTGYEVDLNNCSDPNRRLNDSCRTPAQAGFNEKERILTVGLYFGLAYSALKKYKNWQTERVR